MKKALSDFETAQKEQQEVAGEAFFPVSRSMLEKSDDRFSVDFCSNFVTKRILYYQYRIAKIRYLSNSAKSMLLFAYRSDGYRYPVSPSEVFEMNCSDVLEILNGSIDDIPDDLLILMDRKSGVLDDLSSRQATLEAAARWEFDDFYHSLIRYEARLLRCHLAPMGKGAFLGFQRVAEIFNEIQFFEGDEVSPVAIDFFPSLQDRATRLHGRAKALAWRPESASDPVVVL